MNPFAVLRAPSQVLFGAGMAEATGRVAAAHGRRVLLISDPTIAATPGFGTVEVSLREAGLDVSQNGLNFSLRQQSGQDSGGAANSGRRSARGLSLSATTSIEATAASAAYSARADGRLDIRV